MILFTWFNRARTYIVLACVMAWIGAPSWSPTVSLPSPSIPDRRSLFPGQLSPPRREPLCRQPSLLRRPLPACRACPAGTYVVQRSDTLSSIAQRFHLTVSDLLGANGLTRPNRIFAGQLLVIPGATGKWLTMSGHARTLALDCESRSAADWAGYFGFLIDEREFSAGCPCRTTRTRGLWALCAGGGAKRRPGRTASTPDRSRRCFRHMASVRAPRAGLPGTPCAPKLTPTGLSSCGWWATWATALPYNILPPPTVIQPWWPLTESRRKAPRGSGGDISGRRTAPIPFPRGIPQNRR